MLKVALCNELLAAEGKSFAEQCRIAAALGYMGLELAPGTLGDRPHALGDAAISEIRGTAESHGLAVTGLHWLLAPYPDLSITDPAAAAETQDVLCSLIDLCARLGGTVLVHGSPAQREPLPGDSAAETRDRVIALFQPIAAAAEAAGVTYCLEPLSPAETPFINTVEEAVAVVEAVGSPNFRTMIDTSAAGQAEAIPVAALIRRWVPSGLIGHIQVNDTNRGAPGTGSDPFGEILKALRDSGWDRPVAVEPFVVQGDATRTFAIGLETVTEAWEAAA
ncbi:sugar phosphate isomerase/epimerase family protein [Pelagibius sp.]|uniref:sugar phosphate isomerase/epimerase family protein n=1 Tax=Pelagibius sp. TaxID=1931238 RepID=UPI003B513C3B